MEPLTCLVKTCHLINSSLNLSEVLKGITKMSKEVLNSEAGSLMLLDGTTQTLKFTVALGEKGNKLEKSFSLKVGEGIAGWVAKTGNPIVVPDVRKDPRFTHKVDRFTGFTTRSILAVPLKAKDKIIGVLEAINPKDKSRFSEEDIPLFYAFACQVAVAIENARVHQKMLDQQKLERELSIASEIQTSILPEKRLKSNQVYITAEYKPAEKIGGDFFDIINLDSKIIITLGDVTGKGIPAALYMVRLITELRALVSKYKDISQLTSKLNNILVRRSPFGMFATTIIVEINKSSKEATLVNAGHPDPLWIRVIDKISFLSLNKGLPLGIVEKVEYTPTKITLENGDSLFLYTDGIIEARNEKGKEFGITRLKKSIKEIAKTNRKDILKSLFSRITEFSKNAPQHDDLTAVQIDII